MRKMAVEEFTAAAASSDPVPGGGSIAALAGALAAALAQMVAGLTIGKKKYEEAWEEMEAAVPVERLIKKLCYIITPASHFR